MVTVLHQTIDIIVTRVSVGVTPACGIPEVTFVNHVSIHVHINTTKYETHTLINKL